MKFFKLMLLVIVWTSAGYVISFVNRIYSADKLSVRSADFLRKEEYEKALNTANGSLELNPLEPSYYRTRALVYLTVGILEKDGVKKNIYKKSAYADLQRALVLNPDNLVTERNLVPVYYFLANEDPAAKPGGNNHDSEFIGEAKNYFQMLKAKYSRDAGVISLVAEYERKLGLTEEYEKSKEMVRILRPDLLEWYSSFN
ncbi:hypothetical protein A2473_01525 [candidate division WWE3 bacterium RIFOXYC2_FULL_42_13]|uniref:Tetratricopeptide repeat protein n=1 Tax=candidate division WWE3 bacterium TaxID=2053526 RepID=A0A3D0ZP26_UNCKA|nr:MAG: hypothetical protein A2245_01790 [candidate division WWE3 bacterium RIFOXYA2_FULL_43_12]OGC66798.1 MAG: hypothetical protein A2274_01310 [candidate division WWE3 bacterium RIFOXYA12_FULL_43_11]OGC72627.1 MAG: hypothetical protein A2337_02030 [candidate division WWE3 bacterium RIFOXYB2_FULL_43_9]OGC73683.1 MAG: hypothetical protein A2473_01525 [candidate division WWE3 bacterium RIFOXYC2_FULL_42_13]OGC75194.1 MAG: hypothetical protein A2547_02135 [candidate division WWE3 bacterium RIFOXYD